MLLSPSSVCLIAHRTSTAHLHALDTHASHTSAEHKKTGQWREREKGGFFLDLRYVDLTPSTCISPSIRLFHSGGLFFLLYFVWSSSRRNPPDRRLPRSSCDYYSSRPWIITKQKEWWSWLFFSLFHVAFRFFCARQLHTAGKEDKVKDSSSFLLNSNLYSA